MRESIAGEMCRQQQNLQVPFQFLFMCVVSQACEVELTCECDTQRTPKVSVERQHQLKATLSLS